MVGVKESDQEAVISAAHRLKGAVGNMCAEDVFQFCQEIESQARRADLAAVQEDLPRLQQMLTALRAALNQNLSPQG